jgi:peptidyl-prolyl cis-trans isomerase SurA
MIKTGTVALAALAILAATHLSFSASAQRVQRIAAIVNEDVVSEYDLRARMQVVIVSSKLRPTPKLQQRLAKQVLRNLIDERLQLQEAKRRNIRVSKKNMQRAIAAIEKQNKIGPGSFATYLRQNNLPKDSVESQIRARIAWQKLMRRVLLPRVTVSDDEVDEHLNRLKSRQGQVEYRFSEILLPIDGPEQEPEVLRTAQRLTDELRRGANFAALARQFSQTATASVGGDLGWLHQEAMAATLRKIAANLNEGDTTDPIKTLAGIQIYRLTKKRKVLAGSDNDIVVDLQQILLPLDKNSSPADVEGQTSLARIMTDTVSGCADHAAAAKETGGPGNAKIGKFRLGDLSRNIRQAVATLPIGKASPPIRTPGGIAVLMVCDRKEPANDLPTRDAIKTRLQLDRVEILARRYLRDLRSAAIVDLRV